MYGGISLSANRATFEAFEQRVEDRALSHYLGVYDRAMEEEAEELQALEDERLAYEAGLEAPEREDV